MKGRVRGGLKQPDANAREEWVEGERELPEAKVPERKGWKESK
ncbi:hypothetical protein ACFW4D_09230 [Paenibacillus lactis]